MKITKKLLLPLLAALCLGLSACAPKAMEAFAAWQPEISLYAGDSREFARRQEPYRLYE